VFLYHNAVPLVNSVLILLMMIELQRRSLRFERIERNITDLQADGQKQRANGQR
jgi:hypothetical protein